MGLAVDPAKVAAAIEDAEAQLAAARAEHDEKASEADDLWLRVLDLERRLALLQELAIPAPPVVKAGDPE